jgi:hypothetical protein
MILELKKLQHLEMFGLDTFCFIPFKYVYMYLFCVTYLSIFIVNDYYYLYLIFIDCIIIMTFNHFYNDYTKSDVYKNKYIHEIIDNQWLWMLVLCCHIKFCIMTIKDEFIDLNYIS